MSRMTYAEREALGLILTKRDAILAEAMAEEIRQYGGSRARWERAEATPALYACVQRLVHGNDFSAAMALEQFYRDGETNAARGGRVWRRPEVGPWSKSRNLPGHKGR
jgi:hypothetical protein